MVRIFVAVTDKDWFNFLSQEKPDEVNFWAPSGRMAFRALRPGELFLFKLHSPNDFIVGGGIFSHASNLPLSLAWEAFGSKNGVASLDEMQRRIRLYRHDIEDYPRADQTVGCRILTAPFFWPRELWLPVPQSWSRSIVVGKGYNTDETEGAALWDAVAERSALANGGGDQLPIQRYGSPVLVKPRLGQGAFRIVVTDAYDRRCAISGEKTLPILDAAHIRSYSDGGTHDGSNGLLLRTDIHKLFDLGYVTIDDDLKFVVGKRLKSDFDNGRHYYDLQGTPVRSPQLSSVVPSAASLRWHRQNRFLG